MSKNKVSKSKIQAGSKKPPQKTLKEKRKEQLVSVAQCALDSVFVLVA